MSSNQGQAPPPAGGGGGEQELPKMDGAMSKKKPAPGNPPPPSDGKHRPGTGKEVRKPRHSARRMRFRQGMFQTSKHLNILEEGEEGYGEEDEFTEFGATECTSRISYRDDISTKFSMGSSLYSHKESNGGCCSVKMLLGALCVIVLGGGVGGVLFFTGVLGGSSGDSTTTTEVTIENTTTAPSVEEEIAAVTAIPVPTQNEASSSGSGALYEGIDYTTFDPAIMAEDTPPVPIEDLLPSFTLLTLQESAVATPQSLALQWVKGHPSYAELPNWKKLQLMALASFYYAFNGQAWPADKQKNWLSYEVDECDWGDKGVEGQYMGVGCTDPSTPLLAATTATTSVAKTTEASATTSATNIKPENNRRFTDLNLDWFLGIGNVGFPDALEDGGAGVMGGKANQMPPEVVFLQDLQSLGLMNCGLKATLEGLVPPSLVQLSNLRRLSYRFNNIGGSIPTHLGQLSSLDYLSLGSNFLTGTLPSSLGGLTDVRELFLYSNRLEGSIPYGWNKLTGMIEFSAISNELTGTIPSFVADWQDLEFFFIDHNPLKGTMPPEICSLANLTSILLPCSVGCATECGETCECYEN